MQLSSRITLLKMQDGCRRPSSKILLTCSMNINFCMSWSNHNKTIIFANFSILSMFNLLFYKQFNVKMSNNVLCFMVYTMFHVMMVLLNVTMSPKHLLALAIQPREGTLYSNARSNVDPEYRCGLFQPLVFIVEDDYVFKGRVMLSKIKFDIIFTSKMTLSLQN